MVWGLVGALGVAAGLQVAQPVSGAPLTEAAKLSDAIALTRACPSLMVDQNSVALTLARAGVNLMLIMPEIGRQSEAMALRYLAMDRKSACTLGRTLYGATGVSAAGFLAER